jgi:hypothetical protein
MWEIVTRGSIPQDPRTFELDACSITDNRNYMVSLCSSCEGNPSEWNERTPQDSNWAPAKVENWKVRVDNDVPSDEGSKRSGDLAVEPFEGERLGSGDGRI